MFVCEREQGRTEQAAPSSTAVDFTVFDSENEKHVTGLLNIFGCRFNTLRQSAKY